MQEQQEVYSSSCAVMPLQRHSCSCFTRPTMAVEQKLLMLHLLSHCTWLTSVSCCRYECVQWCDDHPDEPLSLEMIGLLPAALEGPSRVAVSFLVLTRCASLQTEVHKIMHDSLWSHVLAAGEQGRGHLHLLQPGWAPFPQMEDSNTLCSLLLRPEEGKPVLDFPGGWQLQPITGLVYDTVADHAMQNHCPAGCCAT